MNANMKMEIKTENKKSQISYKIKLAREREFFLFQKLVFY